MNKEEQHFCKCGTMLSEEVWSTDATGTHLHGTKEKGRYCPRCAIWYGSYEEDD